MCSTQTNKNIILLIDNSSSMSSFTTDPIKIFNSFIDDQRLIQPNSRLTLWIFNDIPRIIFSNILLKNVKKLQPIIWEETTSLYDAFGDSIDYALNSCYPHMNSEIIIISDGEDTSSFVYTETQIVQLIKKMKALYNWTFTLLGIDINAIKQAEKLGIQQSLQCSYSSKNLSICMKQIANLITYPENKTSDYKTISL